MTHEIATRENGTALTRVEPFVPTTFEETMSLAGVLAKSGFFADSREAAQAVVKILAGRELGFPPIASMTGIYIVKGRVGVGANLMAAAIQRSGRYRYRIVEHTDQRCLLEFFDGATKLGDSAFTMEDAKKAGLGGGDNWRGYPRNMLFARAMSNGCRWHCPGIFGGPVYTPEELDELPEIAREAPTPPSPTATDAPPPATQKAEDIGAGERAAQSGEKPPSYESWGAITMVTELSGGKFSGDALARYFGDGVRNKSQLEAFRGSNPDAFQAGYDKLRADYQAGKAGVTAGAA